MSIVNSVYIRVGRCNIYKVKEILIIKQRH
jgi:hypothetical protein